MVTFMFIDRFDWGRAVILYETPAYLPFVGGSGGFLMASTVHEYMLFEGMAVSGREMQPQQTYKDLLVQNVGNNYASEFDSGFVTSFALLHDIALIRKICDVAATVAFAKLV